MWPLKHSTRFKSVVLAAMSVAMFDTSAFAADPAVLCVQRELRDLGFDPGTLDGLFGGKTARALEEHREKNRIPGDALTRDNAASWCEALARRDPRLAKYASDFAGEDYPPFDPLFSVEAARRSMLFDAQYYLGQLPEPPRTGTDLLGHYLRQGWKEGYDPSALFDTSAYLEANPDVAGSGMDPLTHYVKIGMSEYRGFGDVADDTGFAFLVDANVPAQSVADIQEGLALAQTFLAAHFGGAIPDDVTEKIRVRVVATGQGNTEPGGGGGVATGLSAQNDLLPRPFFDVANVQWNQNTQGRGWTTRTDNIKTVVHEYAHGWQAYLGAMSIYQQPLGDWLNEGIAEYVAYNAIADAGLASLTDIARHQANAARGAQLDSALIVFGNTNSPAWAGHVGYFAVSWLVENSPNGAMSIRILAEDIKAGRSTRQAFAHAFGLTLDSFYEQFDPLRTRMRSNGVSAWSNRPALQMASASDLAAIVNSPSPGSANASLTRNAPAAEKAVSDTNAPTLVASGDPDAGLALIPYGWDGVFQTAQEVDGKWQAKKYSGEVVSYRACQLVDDAHIVCR